MRFIPTTLLALLMLGAVANAQTPKPAPKPAPTARPAPSVESASSEEEELQIAALEGLMAQPTDRSLPILRKVLAGQHSTTVKRRALFVLAQIDQPEAHALLMEAAHSPVPELRTDAIRSIGISGDNESLKALQEIYKTADADTKKDILQGWMIAGDKDLVFQAAENAKTEDEATEAIHMLGVMGATDELRKLSERPASRRGLLDAYAISGDLAGLRKIVDGNGDRAVRVEAVRRIGIIQSDEARAALREIYTRSADPEIKAAALQGMLIAQDDQGVLAL